MPAKNEDLHGNVPDEADVALLIIDMINDFEFPGGDTLFDESWPAAQRIAELAARARRAGIPVIYVNDNFGKWRSDFRQQVNHCLKDGVRGEPIVRLLEPGEQDYFVLKAKHSAFFSTPLDLLLLYLKVKTLIITGVTGDMCILFSASDAFLRDYNLFVPADCIASLTPEDNRRAIEQMERRLDCDTRPSTSLDLGTIRRDGRPGGEAEGPETQGNRRT